MINAIWTTSQPFQRGNWARMPAPESPAAWAQLGGHEFSEEDTNSVSLIRTFRPVHRINRKDAVWAGFAFIKRAGIETQFLPLRKFRTSNAHWSELFQRENYTKMENVQAVFRPKSDNVETLESRTSGARTF